MKPQILFIDDEPNVLDSYRRVLRSQRVEWDMHFFQDAGSAWEYLQTNTADTIVSDVTMPGMSGFDFIRLIRGHAPTSDIPVVMLTGLNDLDLKARALDFGATDLLNKPVSAIDMEARIRSTLRLKQCQDELKRRNQDLEQQVCERTRQLQASRMEIIWRLAKAGEFRDEATGNHVMRVAYYSRLIAQALGEPRDFSETLFLAAPLHDIGKIGIPDAILLKPGKLTEVEWRVMRTHCELGERILSERCRAQCCFLGDGHLLDEFLIVAGPDPVLCMAKEVAAAHHEKWNGRGYPRGLSAEQIPLAARIVAVADVFDALTSRRPYKSASTPEESRQIIVHDSGAHFDPRVVDAFTGSWSGILNVYGALSDKVLGERSAPFEVAIASGGEELLEAFSLVAGATAGSGIAEGFP